MSGRWLRFSVGRVADRRRDDRPGERKYPEMPEREEQEYLRMLEDPWADGTEIDSGWTEDTDDE